MTKRQEYLGTLRRLVSAAVAPQSSSTMLGSRAVSTARWMSMLPATGTRRKVMASWPSSVVSMRAAHTASALMAHSSSTKQPPAAAAPPPPPPAPPPSSSPSAPRPAAASQLRRLWSSARSLISSYSAANCSRGISILAAGGRGERSPVDVRSGGRLYNSGGWVGSAARLSSSSAQPLSLSANAKTRALRV
jgi:hypothetical protein